MYISSPGWTVPAHKTIVAFPIIGYHKEAKKANGISGKLIRLTLSTFYRRSPDKG